MAWRSQLPDGLVDAFRQAAFESQEGTLLLISMGRDEFVVQSYAPESFFAKLIGRLQVLLANHLKADLLILLGRRDKSTGTLLPPQVQVRTFGV